MTSDPIASVESVEVLLRHENRFLISQYGSIDAYVDAQLHGCPNVADEEKKFRLAVEEVMRSWQPLSHVSITNPGEISRGLTLIALYRPPSGWNRCTEILSSVPSLDDRSLDEILDPLASALRSYQSCPPADPLMMPAYAHMVGLIASMLRSATSSPKVLSWSVAFLVWVGALDKDGNAVAGITDFGSVRGKRFKSGEVMAFLRSWTSGADLDRCTEIVNSLIEGEVKAPERVQNARDTAIYLFRQMGGDD